MEVSVSFTDGSRDLNKAEEPLYEVYDTVLGRVWVPTEGLVLTRPARIRYERYPWIEKFEFDGIKPAPARRKGIGTKDARGFVKSLATIYAAAYDEYREYGGDDAFDAEAYFAHAADDFVNRASEPLNRKIVSKFCGFAENMWREGNAEMLRICLEEVIPRLMADEKASAIAGNTFTEEFREYLQNIPDEAIRT